MERSFNIKELVVVIICIALTVLVIGFLIPMLLSYVNKDSAMNDAKNVCELCVTDEIRSAYPNIVIAVQTVGRYYLFDYDISTSTLYELADNPVQATDDNSLGEQIERFCEDTTQYNIDEISLEMSKLPMNVRCFAGEKMKGVVESKVKIDSE